MAKQYAPKESARNIDIPSEEKPNLKAANPLSLRKSPERRSADRGHAAQLLWSFIVAVCLILAAVLQWTAPKNALLEQDRAPAQIRFETINSSQGGS